MGPDVTPMGFRSYRSKLQAAFLILGLAAIGATGWEATRGATAALQQATYGRLTGIHQTRCWQIERYFEEARNHLLALSADESTISAIEEFGEAWKAVPAAVPSSEPVRALRAYYETVFAKRIEKEPEAARLVRELFPAEQRVQSLQYHYLANNPHPPESKDMLLTAPEAGMYGRVHARYHPTLHRFHNAFGFYDIFLIEAREQRVLYTVFKEIDLGVKLSDPPYSNTTLARAFRRAVELTEPDSAVIEDYAPYPPSYFAPASFLATPIRRAGVAIGVLAIQVSIDQINRVMTAGGKWREEGLGETGQAYIVGPDNRLRSDLRPEIERPEHFYASLDRAGLGGDLQERIRRHGTAILNLPVSEGVAADIRSGAGGAHLGQDQSGAEVLRTYRRLEVPGLDWVLVAEMAASEALAPVRALRLRILGIGLGVAAILFVAARWLAGSVTRPLMALASTAQRLGERDFRIRVPVVSRDEVGQLAASFNRMVVQLEQTTVSKQELDRTLNSLINAVFVVAAAKGAKEVDFLAAPLRHGNPAALNLLEYGPEEFGRILFRDLMPEAGTRWPELVARVLEKDELPAAEAALRTKSGRVVPVLFSAVRLPEEQGKPAGILCAAQDISEWKAAQEELRRMSKVFMDSADPIVIADWSGAITGANAEAERAYGWPREQLCNEPISALAAADRAQEWMELFARCRQGELIRNLETEHARRNGERFPVLVTLSPLTGETGGPVAIAVVAKDITERKEAENTLRLKQQELETLAHRLLVAQEEERGRLARELHDDLTQRLAAVAIEAGRLERVPASEPNRWRAGLERIKEEMAKLSRDIHGLARRLHPATLDDLGLAAAIESECRGFFERGGPPVELQVQGPVDSLAKSVQLV